MRGPVVVMAALLLAGCSSDVAAQSAAEAAQAFLRAGPGQACARLAPDTAEAVAKQADGDCGQALADLDLPDASEVQRVEVAGESAQVRLDGQVVFLARFADGWKVTAAGCVREDPDPAVPYECQVKP